jgi:hypothetical protein
MTSLLFAVENCISDRSPLRLQFPKLLRIDEAYAATGHVGSKNPGDFFHFLLAGQSLVFVERAFAHRETNLTVDIEVSAKNLFFVGAKSLDDVPAAACTAEGFGSLRRSSFHFDRDHDFSLFLRSAAVLRVALIVLVEIPANAMSNDSGEAQSSALARQCGTHVTA